MGTQETGRFIVKIGRNCGSGGKGAVVCGMVIVSRRMDRTIGGLKDSPRCQFTRIRLRWLLQTVERTAYKTHDNPTTDSSEFPSPLSSLRVLSTAPFSNTIFHFIPSSLLLIHHTPLKRSSLSPVSLRYSSPSHFDSPFIPRSFCRLSRLRHCYVPETIPGGRRACYERTQVV